MTDALFEMIRARRHGSKLDRKVRQAASNGLVITASDICPAEATVSNVIQASTIRDVLIAKHLPLHYRGLRLQGCYIEGDLDLAFTRWTGELSLVNCRLTGSLILDHAKLAGRITLDGSHVKWVSAHNAVIDGAFLMRDGFVSDEGFYGLGIRVSNSLSLRKSRIVGPENVPHRMAVELFRAELGDLFLSGAEFDGGVYASGMSVARNLRVQGSIFRSREALGWLASGPDFKGALTLAASEIRGSLYLSTATTRGIFEAKGAVNLRSVTCKQLFIHDAIFQYDVDLEGLTYTRLRGVTPMEMLNALKIRSQPCPQAYMQLATYCQSVGDIATRRRTLISLEKSLTRALPHFSLTRLLRGLHGAFVGYGYRAARAIPWLALSVTFASWLIHDHGDFLIDKATQGQSIVSVRNISWPDSFGFVVDSLLPFASLGAKDTWGVQASSPSEWLWLSLFVSFKFGAWGLVALALASFTGAVRKAH